MRHALKILEQRWGLALQFGGFGVWDLAPQRHEVHDSHEWKAMLGCEADDATGSTKTWRGRMCPDDLQPMLDALRLARDRAEAADRAKTELRSRMSHELRTPLNAVLGLRNCCRIAWAGRDSTIGGAASTTSSRPAGIC